MQKRIKHIRVATLNFSAVNISPFEYHDGSKEKEAVNECFKKLLDTYNKENPDSKWNIAKIDRIFQKQRYSILYRPTAGIVRGRLLNKNQYQAVWDAIFQQNQHLVNGIAPIQDSINLLRTFDWMMYQALLIMLYGNINWENLKQLNAQRFIDQLKKWHQKKYLKCQPKINFIIDFIIKQNLDILFLQEVGNQKFQDRIPEDYVTFREGQVLIIVKNNFIIQDNQVSKFHKKFGQKLNFNKDSHYVKFKHYLLCSIHLSSKSQNTDQAKEMLQTFLQIREDYDDLNIIVGIDSNHYLKNFPYFNIYPSDQTLLTTRKKRTSMQLQFQKSEKLVQEVKDHIISNLVLQNQKVQTINCEQIKQDLLPNQDHPYDHFIVFACIRVPHKQIQEDSSEEQLENFSKIVSCQKLTLPKQTKQKNIPKSYKNYQLYKITSPKNSKQRCSRYNFNSSQQKQVQTFNYNHDQSKNKILNKRMKLQVPQQNKNNYSSLQKSIYHSKESNCSKSPTQKCDSMFLQFSCAPKTNISSRNMRSNYLSQYQMKGQWADLDTLRKNEKSKKLSSLNYKKY